MQYPTAVRSAELQIHLLEDDGTIPNNRKLPLILYQSALDFAGNDPARVCEEVFAAHGWGDAWRDGIYPFPHYHSTAHEVRASPGARRGFASVASAASRSPSAPAT
jgi:uncharacterized protein YjlB